MRDHRGRQLVQLTTTPSPRVAVVTTADVDAVHDDLDRPFLEVAFARAGIVLDHRAWEDHAVDWDGFDLVIVRSPWNYVDAESAFRRFLDGRRASRRFHNPVPLIEWNLDKRYLQDLEGRGVPVVPTTYVEREVDLAVALASIEGAELVVKPTVSAGSRHTGRFASGDPAAAELAATILADGRAAMVQPYLSSVDAEGEHAVIVIDGAVAHRARKAQILEVGGTFLGGEYREVITPADADAELDRVARLAADACRDLARERGWLGSDEDLLYARYDVARTAEGAVLLEAELFEPALFLPSGPATADRLVAAVVERIRRTD